MERMTEFTDDMKYIIDLEEENKNLKEEIENHKQNIMQDELEIIPKLKEENKTLKLIQETNEKQLKNDIKERDELREENKKLKEKLSEITMVADDEKQSIEHILELEEEIRSLELENRAMKVESEDLKMWLREKLPLALLKEYMEKFEGVDLKNV